MDILVDKAFLDEIGKLRVHWEAFCDSLPLPDEIRNRKEFRNSVLLLFISVMVFDVLRREKGEVSESLSELFARVEGTLRELVLSCFKEVRIGS
jgi:hypothetical protein